MTRRRIFTSDLLQTNDWRPWAVGTLAAIALVGGLFAAHDRGVPVSGWAVLVGGFGGAVLGALVLGLDKGAWSPRLRWWTEAFGFALLGPLSLVALYMGALITPDAFAPPVDRRV